MKNTLRNVFHSPRFLVGFIIFMIILLTTLIYPYVISRDPLVSLGKGFLEPGDASRSADQPAGKRAFP